jgi:endonuclease/exonuclease/phosphatase (EEP) superfamily protein YafD
MKIISWNLLHRVGATLDQVKHLIACTQPDLLLMQEATDPIDSLPSEIGGHYVRNVLPGRAHGLAAWSPERLRYAPSILALQPGVIIKRICQIIDLEDFAIANVHLSHGQLLNRRQLRRISRILPARAAILGDCNLFGPSLLPGFRDVGPRCPTHAAGTVVPLRLDRCFVRGLHCESAETLGQGTSDHRPIIIRLSAPAARAGWVGRPVDGAAQECPSRR